MLKLEELSHEVEVGSDEGALRFEELIRHLHRPVFEPHDVGDADSSRATDAGLTMHQYLATCLAHRLYNKRQHNYVTTGSELITLFHVYVRTSVSTSNLLSYNC